MNTIPILVLLGSFAGFVAGGCSDTCAAGGSGCGSGGGGSTDVGVVDPCEGKWNLDPCPGGTCVLLAGAVRPACLPGPCASDKDCAGDSWCERAFDELLCVPNGTVVDDSCDCPTCCPAGWACIGGGESSMHCMKGCEGQEQCPAGSSCADTELGFMVCVSGT